MKALLFALLAVGMPAAQATVLRAVAPAPPVVALQSGGTLQPPAPSLVTVPANPYARTLIASLDAPRKLPASTPRRAISRSKEAAEPRRKTVPDAAPQPAASPPIPRSTAPVVTVDTTRPGQSGYVHFFLLNLPDGDTELQVGIELPDERIAWSFPEAGVSVAPFMQSGQLEAGGRTYGIRHLYGIRPFPDDESMQALQRGIRDRVVPWVENSTPYCNPFLQPKELCLSCLGFVLHVLFPGQTPNFPAMPRDFPRTASRLYYTTDDLVLYLTGLIEIRDPFERLAYIQKLALPEYLREELLQLLDATSYKDLPGPLPGAKLKNANDKSAPGARTYSRTPPQRKRL